MFDIENAIADWRRRMLAGGIESPAPLEELELHLRDDMDERIQSGASPSEAFASAVEKLGRTDILQREFKKAEPKLSALRIGLLILGWLAAGSVLGYSVLIWEFDWNFWSFKPRFSGQFYMAAAGILSAHCAIWFLAKASRHLLISGASLLACAATAWLALSFLHDDASAHHIFGGHYIVPAWYRAIRTLVLCFPGILWVWRTIRLRKKQDHPDQNRPTIVLS